MKFFALIFCLLPSLSFSYTNFIGYGYKSCVTCHFNTLGGGPLNDYGRAIYANAIAGKLFYPGSSDEAVSQASGFLGPKKLPQWIRPSVDYRYLQYTQQAFDPEETKRNIPMTTDFNIVLKKGQGDKYIYSFTISQIPDEFGASASEEAAQDNWLSREHYVSMALTPKARAYLGVMDYTYGLRIPDHIAYSKVFPEITQNDQTLGGVLAYSSEQVEGGLHIFTGNPNDTGDVRQKGASLKTEFPLTETLNLGGSLLRSSSEVKEQLYLAVHTRARYGKGSSLIGELGRYSVKGENDSEATVGAYSFVQNLVRLFRGTHFLSTLEFQRDDIERSSTNRFRFGVGLQWFPIQRVEIRPELYNTMVSTASGVEQDRWDMFLQFHLSL